MDERKRLYKSRNNKMICGVCAGIADYFNIDPSIVRVLWAVLALAAGTGVLAYIACAIILPEGESCLPRETAEKDVKREGSFLLWRLILCMSRVLTATFPSAR